MTEAELLRVAARLGHRAVKELDAEQLAVAVLARLRAEPVPAPPRPAVVRARPWVLVLAAAALVLLVLRLTVGPGPGAPVPPAPWPGSPSVLTELDDLSATELETLLESLLPAASSSTHPEGTSYDELDNRSLELLLRSLEG